MKKLLYIFLLYVVALALTMGEAYACRKVTVRQGMDYQKVFSAKNTKYIIKHDINLGGKAVKIGEESSLIFKGGRIVNGKIDGNMTLLEGDISLSDVSGSFKNSDFKSSWSTKTCDYYKAKMLLSLKVVGLVFDEDYTINTFEDAIQTDVCRLKGFNTRFDIKCDLLQSGAKIPTYLIVANGPVKLVSGLKVDYNNNAARGFIRVKNVSKACTVKDLFVENINCNTKNSDLTDVNCIDIYIPGASSVTVQNISVSNIANRANDKIGDAYGSTLGLYVKVKSGVKTTLEIADCSFTEIHNYKNGKIHFEDAGGIYVSEGYPVHNESKVFIHGIIGTNFGKRLIKTDCSNVKMKKIKGSSVYDDTMALISLNSGSGKQYKNADISSVSFTGVTTYVIASSIENNRFSDIYSSITRTATPYTCALYIPSDCVAENLILRGAQQIAVIENDGKKVTIKGVEYDDTESTNTLYAQTAFLTSNSILELRDVIIRTKSIKHLFIDNYPNNDSYRLNLSCSVSNMKFLTSYNSKDYLIKLGSTPHDCHLTFKDCDFEVSGSSRGLFDVEPTKNDRNQFSLRFEDVNVLYTVVEPYCVPLGNVSVNEGTSLELSNVKVKNASRTPFSSNLSRLYLKNDKSNNQSTNENILIQNCTIEDVPINKLTKGIHLSGQNVHWRAN